MELRGYQLECINSVRESLLSTGVALAVLPVGSGKTVIFSEIVRLIASQKSVLIIVNKIKLAKQTAKMFDLFCIAYTFFCAGMNQKKISKVTIATAQSWGKRDDEFDFVILDEVHRLDPERYNAKYHIGFTGTPFTATSHIYGDDCFFKRPCIERTLREMTPEFLVPMYNTPQKESTEIDLSDVRKAGGDFVAKHLSEKLLENLDKIDDQIEDALEKSSSYNHIIVLSVSIEHAEYIHSKLDNSSIVHSKRKDVDSQMDMFTSGRARILVSVLIASEGFDYPPSDCMWFMRPTRSPVLYIQGAGRILRQSPGKDHALMLDYGGITENLGFVYDAHKTIGKKKKDQNIKVCPMCETYNAGTASCCSKCGTNFLTVCQVCGTVKPYGEKCCDLEIDRYKKLTKPTTAVAEVLCDKVKIYIGKKENDFVQIEYFSEGFSFCKELLSYSPRASFTWTRFVKNNGIFVASMMRPNTVAAIIKEKFKPTKVKRYKNGLYWNRKY